MFAHSADLPSAPGRRTRRGRIDAAFKIPAQLTDTPAQLTVTPGPVAGTSLSWIPSPPGWDTVLMSCRGCDYGV